MTIEQAIRNGNGEKIRVGDLVTNGSGWAYEVHEIYAGKLLFAAGIPQWATRYRVVQPETLGPRGRVLESTQYAAR
jgi:hypothetical protein